jgi:hypothetical protein
MSEDQTQESPLHQPEEIETPAATDDLKQTLEALREENSQLQGRVEKLSQVEEESRQVAAEMEALQERNRDLRSRYASSLLKDALRQAAGNLGISPAAAMLHVSEFRCELDDEGQASITPEPTPTLREKMKEDPLLASSKRLTQEHDRVSQALVDRNSTQDPTKLLNDLDRNPKAKAAFISRHGPRAYMALADSARQENLRV